MFGGFIEHLGRCIYGGIYEPDSPLADENGLRTDVLQALERLQIPLVRYPGGNFVSGYRWMDGIGPKEDRPTRIDMAWHATDTNQFGTDEFITFCRRLNTEPYMVVNCGDGDMREARDWVEYCNGTQDTALVKLRRQNGYEAPHRVKYWGVGNEVDGPWQIGYKTPDEYARAYLEFAKVMKWVDPSIKLIASAASHWQGGT
ncbi:partial alpha-N-arabinofuranosidase, partial [uncultured bacterium]